MTDDSVAGRCAAQSRDKDLTNCRLLPSVADRAAKWQGKNSHLKQQAIQ